MAITSFVRIFAGIAMIIFAGAVTVGATGAFFSDTETSTENAFTAGSIDLSIGSQFSSSSNGPGGVFATSTDNDGRTLYNFTDLKPGDSGEGSFQLMVTSNESYLCARSTIATSTENVLIEAETEANDTSADVGELQNHLQFAIFNDANGDGTYDAGEDLNINPVSIGGDGNGFTAEQISGIGWIAAADTSYPDTWLIASSTQPNVTYNAGFMYCFGNFDGTGACTMSNGNDNEAQTDGLSGSIEFQAIQTRNNPTFLCSSLNSQTLPE